MPSTSVLGVLVGLLFDLHSLLGTLPRSCLGHVVRGGSVVRLPTQLALAQSMNRTFINNKENYASQS